MSANRMKHQRPVSSTIRHGSLLPRLLTALVVAAAFSTFQSGDVSAQTAPVAPNPYQQTGSGVVGANQTGVPYAPGIQSGAIQPVIQTLGGAGQSGSAPPVAILYPDPTQYVLSSGDLVNVRLYGSGEYLSTERVSKDGTIQLPLIGSVNLGGITIRQAEDLIATRLKTAGMYRNPDIIITIAESTQPTQTISFAGEKTGVYAVQGPRKLLDVLAGSGGLPATSDRVVSIIRAGSDTPIMVNLGTTSLDLIKANVPVLPGDTIFVERAGVVYLLGAFKQQGAFPIQPGGMTLLQAATVAGGPTFAGKYDDLRIVRTVGTERQEVKVDIKRIQFGLDPDPLLQSGDILFLPTTPLKRVLAAGGLGTLLSAISVLLIAIYQR